jgi:hypothetical protein
MSERYILGGSPVLIRALAEVFSQDPEVTVIDVAGPPGAPDRLVVAMSPERADLLRRALGGQLVVEPDAVIEPFGQDT